ncbi:MAG: hypothetical protein HQK61_05710, partial [Desulfamplus sp.]|nr:hypothetical protein [Desulfamplus sp.]
SLFKSTQTILKEFFKSRGLSLILSLLAFIMVFLAMRYFYRAVYKAANLDRPENRPFFIRVADVVYHIMTFIIATVALLIVLYVSGDWVLLGLALIFLVGIGWTAREALPMFWEQIKLLLNLSTVREGERVIFNSLPWEVKSLNIYTKFYNPSLKGGLIRVPIREVFGLQSRPFHKDEPWFPCEEGHVVRLSDQTIGTVLVQTPEQVILDTMGGCRKTFETSTFLGLNPINLSINTFGVFITFGFDYEHQQLITREIPDKLREFLETELTREPYGKDIVELTVQFKEAGASSLDLLIITVWSGKWASDSLSIGRAIQRMIVDACNKYNWGIPFNQITVHYGNPEPRKI